MNKNYVKKIEPFFTDSRGEISNLINGEVRIKSILLITCKKGATRANHYHKKDMHYSFLIKGKMEYVSKEVNSKSEPKTVIVSKGEMVYTPPMTIHAMKFLEDSVFLAFATEARAQNNYEGDLIRVKLI